MILLGTTEEVTVCDCCGKSNLKKTIAFDNCGEIIYYGVVCASNETGKKSDEIKVDIKKIESTQKIDILLIEATSDHNKSKAVKMAEKKGVDMDYVFSTYGQLEYENNWEKMYSIAHHTRAVKK